MADLREQIKQLIDKRANVWEQGKALNDKVMEEDRAFTAEEEQTWQRINADIATMDARVVELDEIVTREREAAAARERIAGLVTPDTDPEQERSNDRPSDGDQLRRLARGEVRHVDFALSDRDKRETRDLVKGTASAGGNTVPTSFVRRLYEHLVEVSAIRQTNVTVLTTATGEALQIPKTTAHGAAALVAEGGAIAESDPTFGQVTLDAYKYGVLIQVSHELVNDTAVDLEGYLARQAGRALGLASEAHFITGDGSSKPQGITTVSTLGKTAASATAVTTDELIDLMHSVIQPYRSNGTWMFKDSTLAAIRKLKDTTNQYLWAPGLAGSVPSTILGHPYVTELNMPAMTTGLKSVLFGDFSSYWLRDVESLRFETSLDYAFNTDLVTFRALIRCDGDLVDTTGAVKHLIQA